MYKNKNFKKNSKRNSPSNKKPLTAKDIASKLSGSPRYGPVPSRVQVALSNTYTDYRDSSTTNSAHSIGLFEFLAATPAYLTQYYAMYKYAKISSVDVKCEIVNLGSFPITVAMATMPYSDYVGTVSPLSLIERPRAIYLTIGGNSGVNKGRLYRTFNATREMGQLTFDKEHWVTSAQASSTSPQDTDAPIIVSSVGASNDGSDVCAFLLTYRVTYHVVFFSLENVV